MQIFSLDRSSQARCGALVSVVAAALLVGCVDEGQGLTDPLPEGAAGTLDAGGTKNTSGTAGRNAGGQDVVDNGGAAGTGDDEPRGGSELGGTPGVAGSAG